MTINKTENNGTVTFSLCGWLDTQSSEELEKELQKLEKTDNLIFDFDKIEFISSSGLREVVSAYKKQKANGGSFKVINTSNEVMDVFKMTDFDNKLDIS